MDVSRYVNTEELKFTVEFVTPCFLGGADSNAEVRTAPFKNLIRRWWRIVNGNLSPEELWKKESLLFGSTEKNLYTGEIFGKSKVKLRIEEKYWKNSQLRFPDMKISHPQVSKPMETYLGMGPIFWNKEKKASEYNFSSIEEKSHITFVLEVPADSKDMFIEILSYIHYFGTIGSRSRNGWGSIFIRVEDMTLLKPQEIKNKAVDWNLILSDNVKKYPFAIAMDEKGLLCWRAPQRDSWQEAMFDAADIYMKTRMNIKLNGYPGELEDRHLLGYPITHHEYSKWKNDNERLPSELYIKIIMNQKKYAAQIMHLPNLIPLDGFSQEKQKKIWATVHEFLDKNMNRFGGTLK